MKQRSNAMDTRVTNIVYMKRNISKIKYEWFKYIAMVWMCSSKEKNHLLKSSCSVWW